MADDSPPSPVAITGSQALPNWTVSLRSRPAGNRSVGRLGQWLASHAERGFLLYLLLQLSGAYLSAPPQGFGQVPVATEGAMTDSFFALFYLIIVALIVLRLGRVVRVATAHWWTLLMIMMVAVSFLWSHDPDVTVRRTIAVLITCGIGWYLVARYPAREVIQLITIVMVFTAALSLYHGYRQMGGFALGLEWRGAYESKNALARGMVLSATLCMLMLVEPTRHRWLAWAGFFLSCAMVLASQSATGALTLVALVTLVRFSQVLRLRAKVLIPLVLLALLLVAGGVAWLQHNAATMAGHMGKDMTLTGRTDLWTVALIMIQRHPWLGYGFGGFWRGPVGDSGEFWAIVKWPTPHAHNGFVDLTLDLGLIGLLIFVIGLATAMMAAVSRARTARTTSALAPLMILAYTAAYNLTESIVLRHNTMFLLLYAVATSLACGGSERVWGAARTVSGMWRPPRAAA
jgi:exopolysaccharide production protein ExoQ